MSCPLAPLPGTHMVVVGGCGGIGQTLVAAALSLGVRVTVLDLPAALRGAPAPQGVSAIAMDVTDPASVTDAFRRLPAAFDSLVNLAGFARPRTSVEATSLTDWNAVMDASLTGAFLVAQAALPRLRAAARPDAPTAIVHAASGLAARLMPGYGPYGAAKAGLIALTKSLAVENAPLVRANAVAPGAVDTPFLTGGTARPPSGARLDVPAYAASVPLGRIATPGDVALPILFLCGPGAAYMTGQVLWINGGALTP